MNQEQVTGVIRVVVPFVCALLAAQGVSLFGDAALTAQITAAVIGVVSVAWAIWAHTNTSKIIAAAAIDPGVKILIPPDVEATSRGIAALVKDTITTPNVTSTRPGEI